MQRIAETTPALPWTVRVEAALHAAWTWVATPRPVTLQLRPSYGFAALVLLGLLPLAMTERQPPAERPVAVAPAAPVYVQFRLDAADAASVSLAGSFSLWQPTIELHQSSSGVWTATVPLTPGVYRTLHQTDARVALQSTGLSLSGEGRFLRAPEASYPYVGAAVEAGAERLRISAYAGRWLVESIPTPAWGGTARLRIGPVTEAYAGIHNETNDPLYWNTPRRSWSAGLSYHLGGSSRQTAALLPVPAAAGTTFRLPHAASTSAPSVAGDFSGWQAVPMLRNGDFWSVTIPVAPGTYRYTFRDANGVWFVPEGFPGREADGYGRFNAVLIVP